jgi:hypothetical protein
MGMSVVMKVLLFFSHIHKKLRGCAISCGCLGHSVYGVQNIYKRQRGRRTLLGLQDWRLTKALAALKVAGHRCDLNYV